MAAAKAEGANGAILTQGDFLRRLGIEAARRGLCRAPRRTRPKPSPDSSRA